MARTDGCHRGKTTLPQELQAAPYLKNLTPAEELALFLSIRGHCLVDSGRHGEAVEAFRGAQRHAPHDPHYGAFLDDTIMRLGQQASYSIVTGNFSGFMFTGDTR